MKNQLLFTEVDLEIPFHDVDSIQVVWHGHYYKYFEIVRTFMLRKIDYDLPQMMDSGTGWPVIETKCRYIKPLTYGLKYKIQCWITEYEHRLKVNYKIMNQQKNKRLSLGYTIQAAVDLKTGDLKDTEELISRLQPFLLPGTA